MIKKAWILMRNIIITVTGRTELLMHNGRLANPMDPATKELNAAYGDWKRLKTDDAFEELCRVEFVGSLYYYEADGTVIGPYWPSDNFHTCLKAAGAKVKKTGGRGTLKNTVAAALLPGESDINPLSYRSVHGSESAPRGVEALWEDGNYRDTRPANVRGSKVMRTRPVFKNWKFEAGFVLDTEVLDLADLRRVVTVAGQVIGLGDWRPEKGGRRGRFIAAVADMGEAVLDEVA